MTKDIHEYIDKLSAISRHEPDTCMQNVYIISSRWKTGNNPATSAAPLVIILITSVAVCLRCPNQHGKRAPEDGARGAVVRRQRGLRRRRLLHAPA